MTEKAQDSVGTSAVEGKMQDIRVVKAWRSAIREASRACGYIEQRDQEAVLGTGCMVSVLRKGR